MAFLQSAALEFGAWPIEWPIAVVFAAVCTAETIRVGKYFVNMLHIVRPISRDMQSAADGQPGRDQFNKFGLYDTTFVVALLGPWIRKVQIDASKRRCGNLLFQHLYCIVKDQAQIYDSRVLCFEQTMPDTRIVHFDSQKILVGVLRCLFNKRLAVAEADFQHDGLWHLKDGVKL